MLTFVSIRQNHHHRDRAAALYVQFCGLCLCKAEISLRDCCSWLYRNHRHALAGLYGAAVLFMREIGLYNSHWALICLQAFTAFCVFLMRQFYLSVPDELCEAGAC